MVIKYCHRLPREGVQVSVLADTQNRIGYGYETPSVAEFALSSGLDLMISKGAFPCAPFFDSMNTKYVKFHRSFSQT